MKNTGVFASKEETEELRKLATKAQNTPVMALSSEHALKHGGFAGQAWKSMQERCHKLALEHGLPEIQGFYGITQDGEFVET